MLAGLLNAGRQRALIILATCVPVSGAIAEATQCTVGRGFEATAQRADLVVVGRIVRHAPEVRSGSRRVIPFMDVSVLRVLAGTDDSQDIRIWGASPNIFDMRPSIQQFAVGTTWILALTRVSSEAAKRRPQLREGEYSFPLCDVSVRKVPALPPEEAYLRSLTERLRNATRDAEQ